MKEKKWIIVLAVFIAGLIVIGTAPAGFAQETEGIIEGGDQGTVTGDEGFNGAFDDEDFADDWWYDTYSYEEDTDDVWGYYGDEEDWGWYDNDYYTGLYDDEWGEDDWYYDTYDDPGDEGFWDF